MSFRLFGSTINVKKDPKPIPDNNQSDTVNATTDVRDSQQQPTQIPTQETTNLPHIPPLQHSPSPQIPPQELQQHHSPPQTLQSTQPSPDPQPSPHLSQEQTTPTRKIFKIFGKEHPTKPPTTSPTLSASPSSPSPINSTGTSPNISSLPTYSPNRSPLLSVSPTAKVNRPTTDNNEDDSDSDDSDGSYESDGSDDDGEESSSESDEEIAASLPAVAKPIETITIEDSEEDEDTITKVPKKRLGRPRKLKPAKKPKTSRGPKPKKAATKSNAADNVPVETVKVKKRKGWAMAHMFERPIENAAKSASELEVTAKVLEWAKKGGYGDQIDEALVHMANGTLVKKSLLLFQERYLKLQQYVASKGTHLRGLIAEDKSLYNWLKQQKSKLGEYLATDNMTPVHKARVKMLEALLKVSLQSPAKNDVTPQTWLEKYVGYKKFKAPTSVELNKKLSDKSRGPIQDENSVNNSTSEKNDRLQNATTTSAGGKKKRRIRKLDEITESAEVLPEEHEQKRCAWCSATDTRWRNGPTGLKTLCFPCGMRYARVQQAKGLSSRSEDDKDDEYSG